MLKPVCPNDIIVCQLLILHSAGGGVLLLIISFRPLHTDAESLEENLDP